MKRLLRTIRQFLSELRRRNVYRVALAYLAAGFVVVELANIAAGAFDLPGWFQPMVWTVCGLGFPIALVLAWALEVTPEGVRVEEPEGTEETSPTPASTTRDVWVGASVLALLLLGAWWLWGGIGEGGGTDRAEDGKPEIQGRSIAVLPFEVSGAGAEEWRDGMVTMLSTGLDGAGGLRAIPDRTVFARWEEASEAKEGATTEEALSVARRTGARYAVVGSAGVLGNELRFSANVHEVSSGRRLGQALVRGSPDSITALTGQLTRKVLGVLLEKSEEQIPSVDLASVTTESLEALKDFLAGERHYRTGEYEAAAEDFQRAIQRDSTFALAHARLGLSRGWLDGFGAEDALRRAHALSGRLPVRQRRLVWASYVRMVEDRPLQVADSLRRWTEVYPDDPSVWYRLGEVLFHNPVPRGWPEAERAFEKAAELDPGVAPYNRHLMDLAFTLHQDSALAARRIRAHPDDRMKRVYQTFWDLKFGAPDAENDAWARLDTLSERVAPHDLMFDVYHPTDLALQEQVIRHLMQRGDVERAEVDLTLFDNHLRRGQISEGVSLWRKLPEAPRVRLIASLSLGYPVPDSLLRPLEPSRIESGASHPRLAAAIVYSIEKGRFGDVDPLLERWLDALERESIPDHRVERVMSELKGLRAWKAGNLDQAERLWSRLKSAG
jgi:TolB-like protein